jgi:hypothetical protein
VEAEVHLLGVFRVLERLIAPIVRARILRFVVRPLKNYVETLQ